MIKLAVFVSATLFCSLTSLAEDLTVVFDDKPRAEFKELLEYEAKVAAALREKIPVLNLLPADTKSRAALDGVLASSDLGPSLRDPITGNSYRNEVFALRPWRIGDSQFEGCNAQLCTTAEIYNFTLIKSLVLVIKGGVLVEKRELPNFMPEIPDHLVHLATEIARNTPQVASELKGVPGAEKFVMAGTKTALNRTRCERAKHLCVSPTYVVGDKALWTIVDLNEGRVVGLRWTKWSSTAPAAFTEQQLRDELILAEICDKEQEVVRGDWSYKYRLTSSDGIEILQAKYKGVEQYSSAKNVDWHVSYSDKDGFGYSDAIGCPLFSAAAVVPAKLPKIKEMLANGKVIGFEFHLDFISKLWPLPCNYYYEQRFQFFNDGSFRVAVASVGRGCGEPGIYRPVIRIAFPERITQTSEWSSGTWKAWEKEGFVPQDTKTTYASSGAQFKLSAPDGGLEVIPGRGQFNDKGRGDNAYTYFVKQKLGANEGELDLPTIGPCCNTGFEQGPERFIGSEPESLQGAPLVMWYVPQMTNSGKAGEEYCWGSTTVVDGRVEKQEYPCIVGPMFKPVMK
jgi:hypothetical protein